MKKIFSIVGIFILLFSLSACSSEEAQEETTEKSGIESEEEAAQAIEDVSGDVSDLSDSLNEISEDLG